jgi:hypothetical protein
MNTAQVAKVKQSLSAVLSEYTDSHLVIAFEPTTGQPMILVNTPDCKSALAINSILLQIAQNGGIGVTVLQEEE